MEQNVPAGYNGYMHKYAYTGTTHMFKHLYDYGVTYMSVTFKGERVGGKDPS